MIRRTREEDISQIEAIYAKARVYMIKEGNTSQWTKGYPSLEIIQKDIREGVSYVLEEKDEIIGVFSFVLGDEETYQKIEGQWKKEGPYATIHRMASKGTRGKIGLEMINWCKEKSNHLRIDTHEKNVSMRRRIEESGFLHCGTIYVRDHQPRRAYEWWFQEKEEDL